MSQVVDLQGKVYLVTGAGGYIGSRLIQQLLKFGAKNVHFFDVRQPDMSKIAPELRELYKQKVIVFVSDIRKPEHVMKASEGVDCIFHIASYGMSGKEMMNVKMTREVNVTGTENILAACVKLGVNCIVYTSTYNVVFGGQELDNLDESTPYFPIEKHADEYSRTKSIAEQMILKANGTGTLHTCSLRPAAIYGDGEERHFPRIVDYMHKGLFSFTIGDATVDWVYADNLIYANILASEKLLKESHPNEPQIVSGQAYFISDQEPIKNFEFFRPLVEGLGYTYPQINLPVLLMVWFGFINEMIHSVIRNIYDYQPLMSRAEVYKVGVTHYFKPDKSRRDLNYYPIVPMKEGMRRTVEYWQNKEKLRNKSSSLVFTITIVIVVIILSIVIYQLSIV